MDADSFITRWTTREGGAERANYQMFLTELCDVIGVGRPDPAGVTRARNDYVFERAVSPRASSGQTVPKRIDLYKKNAFILEAKQSRLEDGSKAGAGRATHHDHPNAPRGRRGIGKGWDALMQNARTQAEDYVFLLDASHPAPPFLIVCDVGHAIDLYADFSGTGRAYGHFPDRKGFRLYLEDLRKPEVRALLAKVWTEPQALDPARETARVTRQVALRLSAISRRLEMDHAPEDVAHFLMRCIFTMFAEDVDLIPRGAFTALLEDCVEKPSTFAPLLSELWSKMDEKRHSQRFFSAFRTHLRHFNGNLFKRAKVFDLGREEIAELLEAARAKWTEVDPAIFGTLLEQALDRTERRQLGAHYTPRAYVQRLVEMTVMVPLRADWQAALTKAEAAKDDGNDKAAIALVSAFHRKLCATRVLDPACGTGNFLYVALESMKKLEGEVLETLAELGETESIGLDSVDPHQFLGLEINPRAAAIAELVVWIGYLQQHYRTRSGHPGEPILQAFRNINFGRPNGYDAVLDEDGTRPAWPEAEFIVGNPPFIGGKDLRSRLPEGYAEALWAAHPHMNESADFVMYWWDRAAELLTRKATPLRRFGFVTTNSVSQVFQRRVVERHLVARAPISIVDAIADHPWTKAGRDAAAVRIAMTVAVAGKAEGTLWEVVAEKRLDTDEPEILFARREGRINADLSIGVDTTTAMPLRANEGIASPGVKLHGAGFIVSPEDARELGLGSRPGLEDHVRLYRNGRDLTARSREKMVIDLYGLTEREVRKRFPEVYQHVLETVRPDRLGNNRASYRDNWWIFGEPRSELRAALDGLPRYIGTVETAKHRVFQFLDAAIMPDNMIVAIANDDAATLAILSSRIHTVWAPAVGGWLGYGNDPRYSKSRCFDPFPFPQITSRQRAGLSALAEELDETRKRVLSAHPDLTLTGLYNTLEAVRAGTALDAAGKDVQRRGLVLVLSRLHAEIDRLAAEAYGWPQGIADADILARLVALNAERARQEAAGEVRWLRPDYQAPRFSGRIEPGRLDLGEGAAVIAADGLPAFPADRYEQPLAVEALLMRLGKALDAADVARGFKRGGKRIEARVEAALMTLARYGRIDPVEPGRFAARGAA